MKTLTGKKSLYKKEKFSIHTNFNVKTEYFKESKEEYEVS